MNSDSAIWMPLYIGDYLSDTLHLSTLEHGAYMLLLMHYWRNGGPIQNDKASLENITHVAWKNLTHVLAFFTVEKGRLTHKRVEQELARVAELRFKNKERTKRATEARRTMQQEEKTIFPLPALSPLQQPLPLQVENDTELLPKLLAEADGLNLNYFIHAYEVMRGLLRVRQIAKPDQEILADWTERYDMRHFAFPLIEKTLLRFRTAHAGTNPRSFAYFTAALQKATPEHDVVSGLAQQLRT